MSVNAGQCQRIHLSLQNRSSSIDLPYSRYCCPAPGLPSFFDASSSPSCFSLHLQLAVHPHLTSFSCLYCHPAAFVARGVDPRLLSTPILLTCCLAGRASSHSVTLLAANMESPTPSGMASAGRRTHLKRLSLSVISSQGLRESGRSQLGSFTSPSTPERLAGPSARGSNPADREASSPLGRAIGPGGARRQRAFYGSGGGCIQPLHSLDTTNCIPTYSNSSSGALDSAFCSSPLSKNDISGLNNSEQPGSAEASQEPGATFTPSNSASRTTAHETDSNGRRGAVSRSAHARRQGSISYARTPPAGHIERVSALSPVATTIQGYSRQAVVHPSGNIGIDGTAGERSGSSGASSRLPLQTDHLQNDAADTTQPESEAMAQTGSSSPYNEMKVGIGAKSADLLTFIAKKERKCMDLREGNSHYLRRLRRMYWVQLIFLL